MKRFSVLAGAATLVIASSGIAFAAPAFNYDGSLDRARGDTYTIGDSFTVGGSSLLVTALGAQDFGTSGANADGFVGSNGVPVGIWNADGSQLLASTTVLSADLLDGTYRYHALTTPITLDANTTYLIGAVAGGGTEYWGDSDDPPRPGIPDSYSAGSLITPGAARYAPNGSTLTAPTAVGGGPSSRWAPANFQATPVPEPASLGLLVVAAGALLARRRSY